MHDAALATHDAIGTVWRLEAAKVLGAVARISHDVAVAEELAADALGAALEHWQRDGVRANPGAWLTTTAKRRALDWRRPQSMAAAGAADGAGSSPLGPAADLSRRGRACAGRNLVQRCAAASPPLRAASRNRRLPRPCTQALMAQAQLAQYHLLSGVLADLLARLGRHDEARVHWLRTAELTRNAREHELLLERAHNTLPEGGKS